MDLSLTEKIQIRQLLQQPQWATAERVAELLIDKIKEEPNIAETEWQTLQKVLGNEGEIRGIRRFIQTMYNEATKT